MVNRNRIRMADGLNGKLTQVGLLVDKVTGWFIWESIWKERGGQGETEGGNNGKLEWRNDGKKQQYRRQETE